MCNIFLFEKSHEWAVWWCTSVIPTMWQAVAEDFKFKANRVVSKNLCELKAKTFKKGLRMQLSGKVIAY